MEDSGITGVNSMRITSESNNCILISRYHKKSTSFYIDRAKDFLQRYCEVKISGIGNDLVTVCHVVWKLLVDKLAWQTGLTRYAVDVEDKVCGRIYSMSKIEVVMEKTHNFDEVMADDLKNLAEHRIQIDTSSNPLNYYVNLIKSHLQLHGHVKLIGIDTDAYSVVEVARILEDNGGIVNEKGLAFTYVEEERLHGPSESVIPKPRIELILEKSDTFEELIVSESCNITGALEKDRCILVSNWKEPLHYYVNLSKSYLQQHGRVEVVGIGSAICSAVNTAAILTNGGFVKGKHVAETSFIEFRDEQTGLTASNVKIELVLEKSETFDELMEAENGMNITVVSETERSSFAF